MDDGKILDRAVVFFVVAVLIHNADHVRRGADLLTWDVFAAGTAAIVLEVGVVVLVAMRDRLAPLAAAVSGFSLAAGYVLVHFLPARGWLSDSLTSAGHVSPLSWFAASLEVVAAVTLGVAGVIAYRRGDAPVRAKPLRGAVSDPVVLVSALGNAAILAISIAQVL